MYREMRKYNISKTNILKWNVYIIIKEIKVIEKNKTHVLVFEIFNLKMILIFVPYIYHTK